MKQESVNKIITDDGVGITELLAKLNNYSDADFDSAWIQLQQQEIETLAAILIS